MKIIISSLLLCLCLCVNAQTQLSSNPVTTVITSGVTTTVSVLSSGGGDYTTGLTAWWKYKEGTGTTTTDSTGNGNNGTLTSTTWTAGRISGNALSFNGSTSAQTNVNATLFGFSTGFTYIGWIKITDVTVNGTLIYKGDNDVVNDGWAIGVGANGGNPTVLIRAEGSGSDLIYAVNTTAVNGSWHMIAATWDGVVTSAAGCHIYFDGVEQSSIVASSGSGSHADSQSLLPIVGKGLAPSASFFGGVMDEVRMYSAPLTSAQILQIYNYTLTYTK